VTEDNIRGAPDLVVEIISETTRKMHEVTRRKLYERFGVQEHWVVDPELETVKIFSRAQQGYGRAVELSKETNDVLTTELPTGFNLALTEIFCLVCVFRCLDPLVTLHSTSFHSITLSALASASRDGRR
jgi:Uma2 family endonuclease